MMALLLLASALFGFVGAKRSRSGLGIYPEIAPFKAVPEKIQAGQPVTLSWDTRGTVSVTLETIRESNGVVTTLVQKDLPSTGILKVQPAETTTYRMRCDTAFSSGTCMAAEAKVEVEKAVPGVPVFQSGFGGD